VEVWQFGPAHAQVLSGETNGERRAGCGVTREDTAETSSIGGRGRSVTIRRDGPDFVHAWHRVRRGSEQRTT